MFPWALIPSLVFHLGIKSVHFQSNLKSDVEVLDLVNLETTYYVSYKQVFPSSFAHNTMFVISNDYNSYNDSMMELFKQNNVWILVNSPITQDEIEKLPLNLESNFLTIEFQHADTLHLYEWYRVISGPLRNNKIGTIKKQGFTGGKLTFDKSSKWERRSDLGGVVLKDGMTSEDNLHQDNIVMGLWMSPNGDIEQMGLMADIIQSLKEKLNFTIEIMFGADDKYGSLNSDGTWNGIVGELEKNNADMSTAGLTITADRSQVADFTLGIIPDITTLLINTASHRKEQLNLWAYMTVFPIIVWILTLGTMILTAIFFEIYSRCIIFKNFKQGSGFTAGFALGYLAMLQLGAPSDSCSSLSKLCSGKIAVLSVSFLAMVLFAHYTGDLTAFMTVGNAKTTINSFQDVLEQGLKVVVMEGSAEASIIQNAPTDTSMGQIDEVGFATYNEIEAELKRNPKAVMYMSYFESMRNPDYDGLLHFEEGIPSYLGIGLPPGSELRKCFDFYLLKMIQSGVLREILDNWMLGKPKDKSDRIFKEEARTLGYDNLFFPAIVIVLGSITSLTFLVIEKLLIIKP